MKDKIMIEITCHKCNFYWNVNLQFLGINTGFYGDRLCPKCKTNHSISIKTEEYNELLKRRKSETTF